MTITPHLFDAFLKCPTKCWLRANGETPAGNVYAEWVQHQSESYRTNEITRLLPETPPDERALSPCSSRHEEAHFSAHELKAARWRLAADVPLRIDFGSSRGNEAQTPSAPSSTAEARLKEQSLLTSAATNVESRLHVVERIPSEGRGKPAQFIPIRFIFRNKLTQDDKLLMAFDALILSQVLGREASLGKIIHGDGSATLKVKTSALTGEVRKRIEKITALLSSPTRPDLVLNRHCAECEFQARCRKIAVEKDDLSLLAGMSAKERQKLRSKGIFTVTQLSYTFRPRRRPKRLRDKREKYHHSLKALAIREKKIHIVGSPELKIEGTPVYLDVEGLPDRDFYYLIGLRIGHGEAAVQHSLWADAVADEGRIWLEFLAILETVDKPVLFHYGSYETTFLKEMKERHGKPQDESDAAKAIGSAINLVSVIFAQIYFPTWSNGLKAVSAVLGIEGSPDLATGLDAIMMRMEWEKSQRPEAKAQLLSYNASDCFMLCRVSEFIRSASQSRGNMSSTRAQTNQIVQTDQMPRARERWEIFSPAAFAVEDFKFINKCAYFDYQREKVFVRTTPRLRRINKRDHEARPSRHKANTTINFHARHRPDCGCAPAATPIESEHLFFDLKFSGAGVKRWITRFRCEIASCPECRSKFCHPDRPSHRHKYGHALMSWSVYLATYCGLNMNRTRRFMADVFGLSLPDCQYFVFKRVLAAKYETLSQEIFRSLLDFRSLHIDETSVNLKGNTGFVWVLAGVDRAFYFYRPTREADFLSEMLSSFNGVLISDFYSGYDGLKCDQQKCLIHFMRDINEDMLKCPFDSELKSIAERFASLLRGVIESIDKYGLKRRHLTKHSKDVARFLRSLQGQEFSSEVARGYKKRLAKSGQRMFTFVEHDGVPWNNNNAEHAIKRFAKYRRETGGRFTEESLKEYLILATIFETCQFNNVSALKFLLSGETTLAGLLNLAGHASYKRSGGLRERQKSVGNIEVHVETEAKPTIADANQGVVCLESRGGLSKFARKWRFDVAERRSASCLGGLIAIEGIIQQFGLWDRITIERCVERRFQAATGMSEKAVIAQLLYNYCAGGISLEDADALGSDILVRQLVGGRGIARKSTLENWLYGQSVARVASLFRLNNDLASRITELTDTTRRTHLARSLCHRDAPHNVERNVNHEAREVIPGQLDKLGLPENQCGSVLAGIAQNMLAALKLLYLPDDCLELNPRSLQRRVIFLPAELLHHARKASVRVHVPVVWQGWWQRLAEPLKLSVISS